MAPRRPCPRNPNGHQGQQARIQRNRVMDKAPTFVGIDVSKRRLDIHSRPSGESSTFGYDDESVAALIERLVAVAPALIVLEATGGMEVRLAAALAAAGLPVAIVNPRQVRAFARAMGQLAKTDRLDAAVIARFAEAVRPPVRPLPDEATRHLGALVARRRQLLASRDMLPCVCWAAAKRVRGLTAYLNPTRPENSPATTTVPSSILIGKLASRRGAGPPTTLAPAFGSNSDP